MSRENNKKNLISCEKFLRFLQSDERPKKAELDSKFSRTTPKSRCCCSVGGFCEVSLSQPFSLTPTGFAPTEMLYARQTTFDGKNSPHSGLCERVRGLAGVGKALFVENREYHIGCRLSTPNFSLHKSI